MKREIIKNRIRNIRRLLRKNRISCLIVTKPANVTYITGFSGDDSWAIIGLTAVYLITDSRFTQQAQKECSNCTIIERTETLTKTTAEYVHKLKSVKTVAIEASVSLNTFEALKKAFKKRIKIQAGLIESARNIKDNFEVGLIKKAARIAAKALKQALPYMKKGITENELAGNLDFCIRKLGAKNSFETIVAFGPNASRPHHQPGSKKLRQNDTILIDFGVKYKGYCCDVTRCFSIGGKNAFYQKVYDVVKQAQKAAIKKVRAEAKIIDVDFAARRVIANNNLPVYGHGTGHGLGLEIHESPQVSDKNNDILKAGQVITIEPAVYIPGKLGIRIEDDILVTEKGYRILSKNKFENLKLSINS